MSEHQRTVSIVIPTYNGARILSNCLNSLRGLTYSKEHTEIVVADNGSTDSTAAMLADRYPGVKHIAIGENSGFAYACNRGAAEASGEYVAFLNNDALADPGWIQGLFAGLDAGGEGAVCAASHIVSADGEQIEFSGASSNLFGVGRPRSAWGWPDTPEVPEEGSPILFASGGAMLVHRHTFLDAGGFDPNFFAYFEDVDLGWRLWLLGHKVVYAPGAVVRHTGGATGGKLGAHRRYTLWECNSLAVILKNYETGNMERILSAGLMLLYKRALLAAGKAINPAAYRLTAGKDTNAANVERLPRVSVAHLAAIDRFNLRLPAFMAERAEIQSRRVRSDAEILPLLGRAWEPQFAGSDYAEASRSLARAMDLYGIGAGALRNRVLIMAPTAQSEEAKQLAAKLAEVAHVALAIVTGDGPHQQTGGPEFAVHTLGASDPLLLSLIGQADGIIAYVDAEGLSHLALVDAPIVLVGSTQPTGLAPNSYFRLESVDDARLLGFARHPSDQF